MSKVGESMIQGAIEALEFAQGNHNEAKVNIAVESDLSEPEILTIEDTEK